MFWFWISQPPTAYVYKNWPNMNVKNRPCVTDWKIDALRDKFFVSRAILSYFSIVMSSYAKATTSLIAASVSSV